MQSAEIITEIEQHENIILSDDICCIMLDSGIYYPYSDTHRLIFDVCLVDDPKKDVCFYENVVRNNRYGKNGYITLSKKYNDNFVSEMGYPLICKPNDLGSSIGILTIEKESDFSQIEKTFKYTNSIILEKKTGKF